MEFVNVHNFIKNKKTRLACFFVFVDNYIFYIYLFAIINIYMKIFKSLALTVAFLTSSLSIVFASPNQIPAGTLTATPGTNQIGMSWQAPIANGNVSVSDYKIEYRQATANNSTAAFNQYSPNPTSPSVTVTGLVSGASYEFKVTPRDTTGDGPAYILTVSTILLAPINLNGSQINGGVTLSWQAPISGGNPISDYIIEYRLASTTNPFTSYADGVSANTQTSITGLTNGSTYEFRVSAYNGSQGVPSNIVQAMAGAVPAQVANLNPSAGLIANTVNLQWQAPISNGFPITDYNIEYRTVGGVWMNYADGVSSQNSAGLVGLNPNTQYEFRVSAVNTQGAGSPSNIANYTMPTNQVAGYPTQVQGTASGTNCIALQWVAPSNTGSANITDYIIEYRTGSNPFVSYVDGINNNTTANVCGLLTNTFYDFRISSVNQAGNSAPSQVSSVWSMQSMSSPANTTSGVAGSPSIPAAVNFSPTNNGVNASWLPGAAGDCAITDYIVEYKKSSDTVWVEFKDGTSALNSLVVTGLNNGTGYDFRLVAVNCKGRGDVTKTYQATPNANTKVCLPIITRYLKRGASNDKGNMTRLQDFLRDDEKLLTVASNGVFGPSTYNAVIKFQQKYSYDTLLPWKLTKGSGWVYMSTTKKINDLYCSYHK
jgi:titin